MAPDSRRSTLQTEILAALATAPVSSIAALAKSLDKARPSVSRSIKKLAEAGLAEKQGRTWQLTSKGQREAELATRALQTSAKEVVEIAGRKFRAVTGIHERFVRDHLTMGDVMPSIANFAGNPMFDPNSITLGGISTIVDSLYSTKMLGMDTSQLGLSAITGFNDRAEEALSAVTRISDLSDTMVGVTGINARAEEALGGVMRMGDLVGTVAGLSESEILASGAVCSLVQDLIDLPDSIAAWAGPWQPHDFAALAAPIVSAQNTYASILETLGKSDYVLSLGAVADQSRLLSSTLGAVMDVAGYYSTVGDIATGLAIDPELMTIPAHLSAISASLAGVFDESFESLKHPDHLPISVLSDRLYYSSLPVAHYAEFGRHLVQDDGPGAEMGERTTVVHGDRRGIEDLDPLLSQIDPRLVAKRRGAWLTCNGDNPDRHSQAAASMREVLNHVLLVLAPDTLVPRNAKGYITRRARVLFVMEQNEANSDLIDSVCSAVMNGYRQLSNRDHGMPGDYHWPMLHLMHSTEAAILALLIAANIKTS